MCWYFLNITQSYSKVQQIIFYLKMKLQNNKSKSSLKADHL